MFTDPSGMFLQATTVGASTGGPIGAMIGGAIDIFGALLGFGLFGGGGSPDLSAVAFTPVPVQSPGINFLAGDQNQTPEEVTGWKAYVPILGSGLQTYYDIKRGCVQGAVLNGALTVSDFFLIKGAAESVAKGAWKSGSTNWKAVREWYGESRELWYGQGVHHWLIEQNGQWGKKVPTWIKNQPWNLKPLEPPPGVSPRVWDNAVHGRGALGRELGTLERVSAATPDWVKNAGANIAGRLSKGIDWLGCK